MKVLVTGASGFLGHWLTRALCEQGHQTSVLVRKNSSNEDLKGLSCQWAYGDVTDPESLNTACKGMDAVFHLAGVIAYRTVDRPLMEKVNVVGTAHVIEAVQKNNVPRLVHLSSVVAVGAGFQKDQVLNEKSNYNVGHLNIGYSETKRKAEELVVKAVQEKKIDAVILNPSTIYGPGDAKKGSRSVQVKVAQGRFKFYTPGGVNVVDVDDVVQGIISAWKIGKTGERYILSSENMTIKNLFEMIASIAEVPPPTHLLPGWILHSAGFVGDQFQKMGMKFPISSENAWTSSLFHWFDSSKAQSEIGFKPRPAFESVQKSVLWMKENGLLAKK